MIKAIIFDIGNVVWSYEIPCQQFHHYLAGLLKISSEAYEQKYLEVYQDFETDSLNLLDWCRSINPEIGANQIKFGLKKFLSPTIIKKYSNQQVISLIKILRNKFSIGSLSNGENYFIPYVYHSLDNLFHFQIISSQVGLRKPDPRIYQKIFGKVNCLPKEVVFFDDKPENIDGAQKLGINAYLFTGYNQLFSDLSSHLPGEIISILPTPTAHTR